MAQLVVRNIPEDVMDELRNIAKRRGSSMESEVRELIAEAVAHEARLRSFREMSERRLEAFRRLDVTFGESADLIREDRDR